MGVGAAPVTVTITLSPPPWAPNDTDVVPLSSARWTRCPATQVPAELPTSTTSQPSPTARISAWCLETDGSAATMSLSVSPEFSRK